MTETNPYYKPLKPRNHWEVIRWVIFEYNRLKRYEETLSKKEQIRQIWNAYLRLSIVLIGIYLLGNFALAIFDIPTVFIAEYRADLAASWMELESWFSKYQFLLEYTALGLAYGLALGLIGGLAFGLTGGLALGLTLGLALGLSGGLTFGLTGGLAYGSAGGLTFGLARGLAFGLAFGLTFGLTFGLARGLAFGLASGLTFGLAIGLAYGLAIGLTIVISLYLFYFRFFSWPFHFYRSLQPSLVSNPFMHDAGHWLPYPGLTKKLAKLTKVDPKLGGQFVDFLIEHRPLQQKLALRLFHTTTVGHWKQNVLQADVLTFVESMIKSDSNFTPSAIWLAQLEKLRQLLSMSQKQTNSRTAFHVFQTFKTEWQNFKAINLRESPKWNHYYFIVIEQWAEAIDIRERELAQKSQNILSNPFRAGDPLVPGQNSKVFLGREDLRNELSTAIQAAQSMPLFLIQGQRRVGKTSLLNFLADILGERFVIVKMDLQSSAVCRDVGSWLQSIRSRVNAALSHEEEAWTADPEDWIKSWLELSEHLSALTKGRDVKLILAFDEYESLHDRGLSKNSAKGAELLANMRSFSQGQAEVVFLFVGAHLFSELEGPNWADYFVQSIRLKVDYLSKSHVEELLTDPDDEFDLTYEPGFLDEVYTQTQGHPTLVQLIGRELVNLSNKHLRKQITLADLQQVIDQHILNEGNNTINVFWGQFCRAPGMKETVREVILQKTIANKDQLQQLLRHDFVIRDPANTLVMRVPLFEAWIRKFDVAFLEV